MGILDGLQFDPASFGSAGPPGWLGLILPPQPGSSQGSSDRLSPSTTAAPASAAPGRAAGAPQSVAAAPDLANGTAGTANPFAALFGDPRPPAVAAPPATPGIGDRLGAAFMNFANARGFLPAIAGAASGLATGQRNDLASFVHAQQSAAAQALVGVGLPPALAQAAALNPALLQALAPQLMRTPPATTALPAPVPLPRAAASSASQ